MMIGEGKQMTGLNEAVTHADGNVQRHLVYALMHHRTMALVHAVHHAWGYIPLDVLCSKI